MPTFDKRKFRMDLKIYRTVDNKYSMKEVEEATGVAAMQISNIEANVCGPSTQTFLRLCKWMKRNPMEYLKA